MTAPPQSPVSETHALAVEMLAQHGLWDRGWRVRWDRHRSFAGMCSYRAKTLTFSARAVLAWADQPELWLDLVRHEVAHALAGPGDTRGTGHGPAWQKKVRELGGSPAKHCPPFSAGAGLGPWVLTLLAALWVVAPPVAVVLTLPVLAGTLVTLVGSLRPVLTDADAAEIERAVLNP